MQNLSSPGTTHQRVDNRFALLSDLCSDGSLGANEGESLRHPMLMGRDSSVNFSLVQLRLRTDR